MVPAIPMRKGVFLQELEEIVNRGLPLGTAIA